MPNVENKHWGDIRHSPALSSWASYLLLMDYGGNPFNEQQEQAMQRYLLSSEDTYVSSLETPQANLDLPQVRFMMTVGGEDEASALENVISAGIGAFVSVEVPPENIELHAAHLTNQQQLVYDRRTSPDAMITDASYEVNELGYEVFIEELSLFADCMALLKR